LANELQDYAGQMLGTTTDGTVLRVKVNDQGELVINLEAATVNIGDVDVLSLPSTPAGNNLIGKVGVDQTTDGVTNRVVAKISQTAGENKVVPVDTDGDEKFTDANPATVKLSGSIATMTHTSVTAAVNTTAALAANANRKYALLVNDSDEVIYIKLGAAAVLNEGIRLNANGGGYEMSNSIGNLTTGAINCISTSGGKILLATEGV
jgi:hypothetical protein